MGRWWLSAVLCGTALAAPILASAHAPFLLPNTFDASDRKHVTVFASFTETFFEPDVVMKADDYHLIAPDGTKVPLTPIYAQDLAIIEAPMTVQGTYRISTGQRSGRTAKAALVNGEWEFLAKDKPAPAGAKVYDVKSITTADVYVSRGAPTKTALTPRNVGLEFRPLTHPNSVFVASEVQFEVLFDGRPLAKQSIDIHADNERYSDKKKYAQAVTDEAGRFSVRIERPGVYLAMTRYRLEPKTAGKPATSHTYSVTFEATD
jgi:uncharacterized GH25 family protein